MHNIRVIDGNSHVVNSRHVLLASSDVAQGVLVAVERAETMTDALDALLRSGFARAGSFCVAAIDDTGFHAVLRGEVGLRMEAQWGEAETVDGRGVRSIREITAQGVARFAIVDGSSWSLLDTPIRRYTELREVADDEVRGAVIVWEHEPEPTPSLITEPKQHDAFPENLFGEPEQAQHLGETTQLPNLYDELFGVTLHTNIERAAVRPAEESAPTPSPVPASTWVAQLPGGDVVEIGDGITGNVVIVGRRPAPVAHIRADHTKLVTVHHPGGNISRSHALLALHDGECTVQDLGSMNGTVRVRGEQHLVLDPGMPSVLHDGDDIVLGGDAVIRVRKVT